jgi:hypothetical protein
MWKSHLAAGDYHHNMNQENYEKWVKENHYLIFLPKVLL